MLTCLISHTLIKQWLSHDWPHDQPSNLVASYPLTNLSSIAIFRLKLRRLARDLRRWSRFQVGDIKLQLAVAFEVIFQLEVAQESRLLSAEEQHLLSGLKTKVLGLAVLNKLRLRQRSRLTWLKEGDVNSKFFHIKANTRRRKNYIHSLQTPSGVAVSAQNKEEELFRFFKERLGTNFQRTLSLNWSLLQLPSLDLNELDEDITEEELKSIIFDLPPEKAPSPDGFIGAFFKTAWPTVKDDLLAAILSFMHLNTSQLAELNSAFICLIPKKDDATGADHFRPISLMHSFAKIITKILANRLAPRLNEMISQNQSAFVRKRAIHDNFLYVQNMVQMLHR